MKHFSEKLNGRDHMGDLILKWTNDNIKMELRQRECGGMKWVEIVQYESIVFTVMNFLVP
jgi:hypothetical protein